MPLSIRGPDDDRQTLRVCSEHQRCLDVLLLNIGLVYAYLVDPEVSFLFFFFFLLFKLVTIESTSSSFCMSCPVRPMYTIKRGISEHLRERRC
jgi:hypothetical protein